METWTFVKQYAADRRRDRTAAADGHRLGRLVRRGAVRVGPAEVGAPDLAPTDSRRPRRAGRPGPALA